MNYRMIAHILGWILIFESIFLVVPLITGLYYGEKEFWYFLGTGLLCFVTGRLITLKKPENKRLFAREGFVIVSLSWIVLSFFGALPMFFCGSIPNFVDALFETVSGFTTTGASILSDVESLPKSVLMWRSFTHWIGGMGVLVFIMAFVSLSGGQNMHIMKAESPGPSVSKLVPRVRTTAMILYSIYFILTLAEFISLLCCGMKIFDALNTSFATAGTGGFGIKNDSMGGYSSAIQIVVTVFMILFSVNFNSYYLIILRKFKDAFNTEVRLFFGIVAASTLIIAVNISDMYGGFWEGLKHSAFTVASLISTTGFSTVDFNLWSELCRTILVLVMFIGACAGSTGGGIKVSRIVILFKGLAKELRVMTHPHRVEKVSIDSRTVDHETVRSVNMYMVCYIMVFVLSMLALSFEKSDLITNFTAVTAAINNIGPGLELVGPTSNFGFFSIPSKIVLIFDMLAGRLELFPMLLLLVPSTWKK